MDHAVTIRPVRLQLSRRKGFNLQALSRATNGLDAVVVTRGGKWGNPFVIGEKPDQRIACKWGWANSRPGRELITRDARHAMLRFRHCLFWDSATHDAVRREIGGRNVACVCKPGHYCHGDPILWIANTPASEIERLQSIIAVAEAMRVYDKFLLEIANA